MMRSQPNDLEDVFLVRVVIVNINVVVNIFVAIFIGFSYGQ